MFAQILSQRRGRKQSVRGRFTIAPHLRGIVLPSRHLHRQLLQPMPSAGIVPLSPSGSQMRNAVGQETNHRQGELYGASRSRSQPVGVRR